MDKRALVSAVALGVALLGLGGYSFVSNRSQASADRDSLKAQQALAHRGRGPGGRGSGGGMRGMASQLGLTADQQTKMDAVMKEMRAARHSGTRPSRADVEAMRAKMDAILTPEQRQKMQSMRPPQGGPGGPPPDGMRPGGPGGGPPPDGMPPMGGPPANG